MGGNRKVYIPVLTLSCLMTFNGLFHFMWFSFLMYHMLKMFWEQERKGKFPIDILASKFWKSVRGGYLWLDGKFERLFKKWQ